MKGGEDQYFFIFNFSKSLMKTNTTVSLKSISCHVMILDMAISPSSFLQLVCYVGSIHVVAHPK